MKNHLTRRFLALALAVVMVLGCFPAVSAAPSGLRFEETNTKVTLDRSDREVQELHTATDTPLPTAQVRVAIVLEEPATAERYSTTAIGSNADAKAHNQALEARQADVAKSISKLALGGKELDVVWNLTLVANLISANVPYGKIEAIKAVPGVKAVILEQQYEPQTAREEAGTNMYPSSGMIGSAPVWASGYTGAGMRIAIVDTGTDWDHQSLDNGAYLYALEENARVKGMSTEEYVASLDLLDAAEIATVLEQLNATERIGASAAEYYFNEKLPFGANYVDKNLNFDNDHDNQGDHGSHVAGIAAANRYLPEGDGYVSARDTVRMSGVAPDAQILTMKVFGNAAGPYDSDFFAAIEDAIWLGCDSVNLSLGSNAAGFAYDEFFADVLEFLETTDTVVAISAGNAGTWAYSSAVGDLYNDGMYFDTVGSPGSYTNALTVASVNNDGSVGQGFSVGERTVVYTDGQGSQKAFASLDTSADGTGTELEYIFIDGLGHPADYNGMDLTGKVVFCSRGEISFFEKANYAAEYGAAATIVYNNQAGNIGMDLTGYNYTQPCASILQGDADYIRMSSTKQTTAEGVTYYTGHLTISRQLAATIYDSEFYTMSDFSSWGVPGSLELKPEITAPGGLIWSLSSASSANQYQLMSGTSMASPQVAGMAALVSQYIQENDLAAKTGLSVRQLAHSLLMSTAEPLFEESNDGGYYSVLNQGSGLARVDLATSAESYVLVDGQNDGKVKAELGDDADRLGDYSFSFSLNNLSGEAMTYALSADLFTQDTYYLDETTTYLRTYTRPMAANAAFSVDGVALDSMDFACDLNGDGVTNTRDADYLLEYLLGNVDKLYADGDVSGDGKVNSYDAHVLLSKSSGNFTVNVPADGSVTVDVRLTLTPAEKELLNTTTPKGAYVEGFVYAEPVLSAEGSQGVTHSIPVLGYYGSWTDSRMFDVGSYLEYEYGNEVRPGYLYHVNGNQTNFMTVNYGGDTEFVFGGNPIMIEDAYRPERNAFNNQNGASLSAIRFALIRNAADTRLQVANLTEDTLYYDVPMGQQIGAFFDNNRGNWAYAAQMLGLGLNMAGEPEGTQMEVRLVAVPEYYRHFDEEAGEWVFDYDSLGEGAYLRFPFTIDNTAPKMLDAKLGENNTLTVTAQDNQYVSAVALMNMAGTTILTAAVPEQTEANQVTSATLDLNKVFGSEFLVAVFDYAENVSTYAVTLELDTERPRFTGIDRTNTDSDWNISYVGLYPEDGSSVKLGTCVGREPARAAEYVDGAVFEITNDNQLWVGYDKDLSGLRYLADLDPTGEYQLVGFNDLAYNTADGKLYGNFYSYLNNMNSSYLCTIDMDNGEMEVLGELPIDANSMTIDDEGNFYSAIYGTSKLYTYKADAPTTKEVTYVCGLDGFSTGSLNSMAWDHDTDELYWACSSGGSTNLVKINPDPNAESATEWISWFNFSIVGLYIVPENPGNQFAPTDRVDSVRMISESAALVNTQTTLTADVMPWYASDITVTWTSSDESVATVDAKGAVTGVAPGTAVITATSNLDNTKSASCTVTVTGLDTKLNALIWDEEGMVHFGHFQADNPTGYTKVAAALDNLPLNATATVNGKLYASAMDTENLDSVLFEVNPETYELTLKGGTTDLAYTDMAYLPNMGCIMATFGSYIVMVDPETGMYDGLFNWYGDMGNLVGITYYGSEYNETYGAWMDYIFLLDDFGNVFFDAFINAGGEDVGYFNGTEGFIQSLGKEVDTPYFQGFHYDGEYVFWNRFSEDENSVEVRVWDCNDTSNVYSMGRFPTGVWPVGGLYTDAELTTNAAALVPMGTELHGMAKDVDIASVTLEPKAPTGSLNGFAVQAAHAPLRVTVPVTLPAEGTNGVITASYNTAQLELVNVAGVTPAFAYTADEGTLKMAFADRNALPEGNVVAYLTFEPKVSGEATVSFHTQELGTEAVSLDSSVTVKLPGRCPSERFVDVKQDDWFHEDVDYVLEAGFMNGMDETHFGPALTMNRAQFVTVLYRIFTNYFVDNSAPYDGRFTDIPTDGTADWYIPAVAWAVQTGITTGATETTFNPGGQLTRTELIVFLYRFAELIGCDMTANTDMSVYRDADQVLEFAREAWNWGVTQGMITGRPGNVLDPMTTANRAEAATIFHRFMVRFGGA